MTNLPKEEVSVYFDVQSDAYRFSDGFIMPLSAYDKYVKDKLGSEYPTEPKETSEAIFKARAYWEASS